MRIYPNDPEFFSLFTIPLLRGVKYFETDYQVFSSSTLGLFSNKMLYPLANLHQSENISYQIRNTIQQQKLLSDEAYLLKQGYMDMYTTKKKIKIQ